MFFENPAPILTTYSYYQGFQRKRIRSSAWSTEYIAETGAGRSIFSLRFAQ